MTREQLATREDAVGRNWAPIVAWSLWLLGLVAIGSILLLAAAPGSNALGEDMVFAAVFIVLELTYSTVGAAIVARRPDHFAGWMLLITGVAFGFVMLAAGYANDSAKPGAAFAAWVAGWAFEGILGGFAIFFMLLFPNGRLVGARWRFVAWLAVVSIVLFCLGKAFDPLTFADSYASLENPFSAPSPWGELAHVASLLGNVGIVLSMALAGLSLVVRFRRAPAIERLQIKWVAYVGVGIAIVIPIAALQLAPISDIAFLVGFTLIAWLPVAVAVAVLRYRLLEIDRLISRTFVFGILTAFLAGVYSAAMALFQALFVALTGNTSDAAIVLTTLVLAATLTPVKDRLEDFASGHLGTRDAELETVGPATSTDVMAPGAPRRPLSLDDPADVAALEALVERVIQRQHGPS